ncbi:MAG: hypothetical protein WKG32_08360 [Gemmatimonadaceae bacterium]
MRVIAGAIVAAALLSACDDDATGPGQACDVTNPVYGVRLVSRSDTIFARTPARGTDTLTASAQALGRFGAVRANTPIRFTSSDTTVAVVDSLGVVRARGPGQARITAQACGERDSFLVTVASAIATVTVSPDTLTAVAGDTVIVRARATDQTGRALTDVPFTFTVSDTTVASIARTSDSTARVIFKKAGTVRVTAFAEGTSDTSDLTAIARQILQLDAGGDLVCGTGPVGRAY